MTGKMETHPKQMVKNADKQSNPNLLMSFVCSFMNANNPPNHPGMKMIHMVHSNTAIEISVSIPKMVHLAKEMYPV
jgi:hypothetical protein